MDDIPLSNNLRRRRRLFYGWWVVLAASIQGFFGIGIVTSGNFFPHKQQGVGMGYVKTPFSTLGTEISVAIRCRSVPAVVAKPPFHKKK